MTPSFEHFINEHVIPNNWKILSRRFGVEVWTLSQQRLKIIGEIIEFAEAMEEYHADPSDEKREAAKLELADIIISCCTLIRLQGPGRFYHYIPVNLVDDYMGWVELICARSTNQCISSVASYGERLGFDVEVSIERKLVYNSKRKDW